MKSSAAQNSELDRATTPPVVVVEFGAYVSGDSFEYLLSQSLEQNVDSSTQPRVCVLDFRETRWIDIASTQLITAFALAARKKNWLITVRPPANKAARDFWRFWGFPDAFESATSTPFSRLVAGTDRAFLSEVQTTFTERSTLQLHDPLNPSAARSRNFFGFVSDPISGSNMAHIASSQAEKWTSSDVQDVLEKHVGGRCDYIPTRVVFEAVFNATKHPGATIIQSASYHHKFAKRTGDRDRDADFVVFFWDNGRSMLSTIVEALASNVDIKRHYIKDFAKSYNLHYKRQQTGEKYEEVVNSDLELTRDTPDELKVLSTIFPGVSTKPDAGIYHEVHPDVESFDERFARRGMGLFVLVNAVVEVLNGSVSFRTDRFYMHVSKHKPRTAKKVGSPLKVQIVEMAECLPEFEGNMVVVRIPTEKVNDENSGAPDPV